MEQIGVGRAHPGGAVEMFAVKTGVQLNFKIGERHRVFGTASSRVQLKSESNPPHTLPRKIELSGSCNPSGLAVSNCSKLSGWTQETNRTQGRLPRDQFASAVQRTGNGADSVGTSNFREPMDKQSSFTVLANSGKTVSGAVCDSTDDGSSSRWEFLKSLKHRLVRDIAFVIASPSLLLDSDELPMVSSGMLGGDDKDWLQNAHWLKQLDGESVESWFRARPTRNRLGDHFALCVEYALRFLPTAQIHHLVVSQQVLEQFSTAGEPKPTVSSSQAPKDSSLTMVGVRQGDDVPSTSHKAVVADEEDSEHAGRRKKRMRRKLQRDTTGLGIPRTIGEFDFLFQLKPRQVVNTDQKATDVGAECFPQKLNAKSRTRTGGSLTREFDTLALSSGQVVQHWEVSVKYLLYTGPWEPFGLLTPDYASWSNVKRNQVVSDSGKDGAGADIRNDEEYDDDEEEEEDSTFFTRDETEMMPDSNLRFSSDSDTQNEGDNFLGCFLGPHVGESLVEKKKKLCVQLALCDRPEASALVYKLFPEEAQQDDTTEVELKNQIQVTPRALLNGYLFYEYNLWRILRKKQGNLEADKHDPTGDGGKEPSSKAILNRRHWMGWWCRINEFIHIPFRRDSRWYIVPKLEWLSPVVIEGSDAERCARVLDVPGLREAAAKLAAEARERNIPSKRRVLLAEVRWESNALDSQGGRWVESSRGFVVEKTWPNSRLYQPHGFDMSWSPTLAVPKW